MDPDAHPRGDILSLRVVNNAVKTKSVQSPSLPIMGHTASLSRASSEQEQHPGSLSGPSGKVLLWPQKLCCQGFSQKLQTALSHKNLKVKDRVLWYTWRLSCCPVSFMSLIPAVTGHYCMYPLFPHSTTEYGVIFEFLCHFIESFPFNPHFEREAEEGTITPIL